MKYILVTGFVTITKPFTSVPHGGTVLKDMVVKCNFKNDAHKQFKSGVCGNPAAVWLQTGMGNQSEAQSIIVNNHYSVVWDVCLNTIDTVYVLSSSLNCSS